MIRAIFCLVALGASACATPPSEAAAQTAEATLPRDFKAVSPPFYIGYLEDPWETILLRCPDGPDKGCAQDGLPGPRVIAAGADARYVVIASLPIDGGDDPPHLEYFYFARISQERSGWGANPERIVGPLTEAAFRTAKAQLRLPDFTEHLP